MLLIPVLMLVAGCAVRVVQVPVKDSVPAKIHSTGKDKALAAEYFRFGRFNYQDCRFRDSIDYLIKAISKEDSSKRKAQCYIYIGASYFYLDELEEAKFSFVKAKALDPEAVVSEREFSPQIIRVFRSVE